jgi:ABC-type phosphate transport system substrate-binding protein
MLRPIVVLFALAANPAHSQAPYQPQPASPPKDAGYVLADGTIQIVGWDDLAGMFANLNALYARSHPGTKFSYVPGNLVAPQHSLILGETAFAPLGMEFSSNLNSAYRPVDPRIREFLRYVLSRQGQEDVVREGDHLPLTPALAQEQLKKFD